MVNHIIRIVAGNGEACAMKCEQMQDAVYHAIDSVWA